MKLHEQRFLTFSSGGLLPGYEVVSCLACGCCYADRIPGQSAFDRYYQEMSKYESTAPTGIDSPADARRFEDIASRLQAVFPNRALRILEVGCATGSLLANLKRAGYVDLTGMDPSVECARVAEALHQVRIRTGTLAHHEIPDGSVDLAILIGVLEHVRDLNAAMESLLAMLGPEGCLFVTVPDASRYSDGQDAPFQEFSPEHINFFGPTTLDALMGRHGLSLLTREQVPYRMNRRTVTPVIHAAYARTLEFAGTSAVDDETRRGISNYVLRSREAQRRLDPLLESIARSGLPLLLWGAGSHTLRLLASSPLAEARVTAVVDSNPRYQGLTLGGLPILRPQEVRSSDGVILVSSWGAQEAILRQVQEELGLTNELITLYSFPANLPVPAEEQSD